MGSLEYIMSFASWGLVNFINWFVLNWWFSRYIPFTGISLESVDCPNVNDVENPVPGVVPNPTDSAALKYTWLFFAESK